eukprot:TRINITY_DN20469_c0_g1_i1.p1 TRINITY_DN20469_c0_g1~~TRINITY_DN20469_c0_g1_i1.p1  ORF type:complete len:427 (+),score=57.82 TRINITY_DN20469_c0_g1_i1:176-1282(+)
MKEHKELMAHEAKQIISQVEEPCWSWEFEGTRCFSKGSYVPKYKEGVGGCLVGEFCLKGDVKKCAQWGAGKYTKKPKICDSRPARPCTFNDVLDGMRSGTWDDMGTRFSLQSCEMLTIDRKAILDAFRGKRVLFSGDSIMRQIYIRLIGVLRGQSVFIEHYYHQDSYFGCNEEADDWLVVGGIQKGKLLGNGKPAVVELYYRWDPFPAKHRAGMTEIEPDYHFASHMYWWKGKEPLQYIDKFVQDAHGYARSHPQYRLFYLTTPWTTDGTFGGVDAAKRIPRNAYVSSQLLAPSLHNIYMLDYSAYADIRKFEKTADGIHYMCIWRPKYPEPIKPKDSKIKATNCEDPMNGNWVTVMMNAVIAEKAGR